MCRPSIARRNPASVADQGGASHAPRNAGDHQHAQCPEYCNAESPPERRQAEELFADRNDPFAKRWMNDIGRVIGEDVQFPVENLLVGLLDEVLLAAVLQEGPSVLGVVRLVEDERLGLGQVPEAQNPCDQCDG